MQTRLKCFGIGLNKTGTKTLGAALRRLGYRTCTFNPALTERIGLPGSIEAALDCARDFDGFEDWPWPLIYRELDAAFPNSKFVLTLRESPRVWFDSLVRHALRTGPTTVRKIAYGYSNPWEDQARHLEIYERHATEAAACFAGRADQFMRVCWERGDGWKELCAFLGRPVPGVPFPHENSTDVQRIQPR